MEFRTAIAALALATASVTMAHAQTSAPRQVAATASGDELTRIETQRGALFQRMLDQPDDLDAAFAYAALSVQAGDLEAAISTLERMLIYAPGLPRLKLELSLLYFRLNALDSARLHLEEALAGDLPDEVRRKAETLLARIDQGEQTDVFTAQLRAGIRYQTNANRAPIGSNVTLNGIPFVLSRDARARDDGNVFIAGSMHYAVDLERQGDTFDFDVIGYGARQFEIDDINTALLETSIGPSFGLGRFEIDNAKLGIFGIAAGTLLDDEFYLGSLGVGTRFVRQFTPETGLLLKAEYRRRWFKDIDVAPNGSERTGNLFAGGAVLNHVINPDLLFTATANISRATAEEDYLAFTDGGGSVGLSRGFIDPTGLTERRWIASISAGGVWRRYDDPNPVTNPDFTQEDRELFVSGTLTVPLAQAGWAVVGQAEYRDVRSNYDTSDHDNVSVSLSVVRNW